MKKFDFLPNRLNKFSIRKFTVGIASVLVGSTLILGINQKEVSASETQRNENVIVEEPNSDSSVNEGIENNQKIPISEKEI